MAQYVKQGNIFGRVGSAIGKGLAEQIPKEVERNRLRSGLDELSQKKNLTPFQQLGELATLPGVTPQLIESGSKLLKHQQTREGFRNSGQGKEMPSRTQGQSIKDIEFAGGKNQSPRQSGREIPSGEPQINPENPLGDKFTPAVPWSPQQRDSDINRVWDQHPEYTFQEAAQVSSDNEKRYLAAPQAYQAQQNYREGVQDKVNKEIESQLLNKLQKTTMPEVWKDLTGESKNRIDRGIANELAMNPNASVKDVVNTWTDKALENAKAKTSLDTVAKRDFYDKVTKKSDTLKKLQGASKSFKDFGNSEEYEDILKKSFDLSPQGAASVAYPPSSTASKWLGSVKPSNADDYYQNSIKYAAQVANGNVLGRDDSVLSLAKNIKERDPFFDQSAFFTYLNENQDSLSPKDKRDLIEGPKDIFPNWGDIWLFPKFKG